MPVDAVQNSSNLCGKPTGEVNDKASSRVQSWSKQATKWQTGWKMNTKIGEWGKHSLVVSFKWDVVSSHKSLEMWTAVQAAHRQERPERALGIHTSLAEHEAYACTGEMWEGLEESKSWDRHKGSEFWIYSQTQSYQQEERKSLTGSRCWTQFLNNHWLTTKLCCHRGDT